MSVVDSLEIYLWQVYVGADQFFKVILDGKIEGENGPAAMNSKLGWLLAGPAVLSPNSGSEEYSLSNLIIEGKNDNPFELVNRENRELLDSFKQLWEIETCTNEIDPEGYENLGQLYIKYNGERYGVGLPWRTDIAESLPTDYLQCLNRLKSLHARLQRDHESLREYRNIIQEQLCAGVIEVVPKDEEKKSGTHSMPHHGVVRKDRKTTKLRIVFDSSFNFCRLPFGLKPSPSIIGGTIRKHLSAYEGEYEGGKYDKIVQIFKFVVCCLI